MLKEYGRDKASFRDFLRKFLLIFTAVFLFVLALVLFGFLASLTTFKEKEGARLAVEQERAILATVRFAIKEMGFVKRNVGAQDVYIPSLTVLVSNDSKNVIEDLSVRVFFNSDR